MDRNDAQAMFNGVDRHVIDPHEHGIQDLGEADLIRMGITMGEGQPGLEDNDRPDPVAETAPSPIAAGALEGEPGQSSIRFKIDSTWPRDRKRVDRLWRLDDGGRQDYVCALNKLVEREELISQQLGKMFSADSMRAYAKKATASKCRKMTDAGLAAAAAAAAEYLRTTLVTERDFDRFSGSCK
jgi:hypothetical protein